MSARHIVWIPQPLRQWDPLPPANPWPGARIAAGGWRTMHELAVAISATGRRVEMRGAVATDELEELAAAAGVPAPELPETPYRAGPGDTILLFEGCPDPRDFAYVAATGARAVVLELAPPGMNGWPFRSGWTRPSPHTVPIEDLARAEDLRATTASGFEMWTHMPHFAELARRAGVPCHFIGNGRPLAYPEPQEKRYDVATVLNNRWAEQAAAVVGRLDGAIVHHAIGETTNAELVERLGQARVFVHPMRVEGHSRLCMEARGIGTVPVVLDSNVFGVGLDEASGVVAVPSLEAMPAAVEALLADPDRLAGLAERGIRSAHEQIDWETYVGRVDAALRSPLDDPSREARWEMAQVVALDVGGELAERDGRIEALTAERDRLAAQAAQMRETRAWRLGMRYWSLRGRLPGRTRA